MADIGTLVGATPLNASDDTRHVFTDDTTESASYALSDTPADLGNVDTLNWTVEYLQSGRDVTNPDTYGLSIRITNGATILAAADSGGTYQTVNADVTNTSDTTTGPTAFTYVNTTASKTTWDGATVDIQQTYTQLKSADAGHIEVDYVAITGTYTASSGVTGTGSLLSQSSSIAGTGELEHTGTGSLSSQSSSLSGVGILEHIGSGSLASQSSSISGSGYLEHPGTGMLSAQTASVSGVGGFVWSGIGSIESQSSSISGTGSVYVGGTLLGTGGIISQPSTISGTGSVMHLGKGHGITINSENYSIIICYEDTGVKLH